MSGTEHEQLREVLKKATPPIAETELRLDLWPKMLRKLDERAPGAPWYDWVLVALLSAIMLLYPEIILGLLYHL